MCSFDSIGVLAKLVKGIGDARGLNCLISTDAFVLKTVILHIRFLHYRSKCDFFVFQEHSSSID